VILSLGAWRVYGEPTRICNLPGLGREPALEATPDDHLVGYPKTRATGTCNTEKGARGEPKAAALAAPSARLEDLRSEVRWLVAV
jgi:hypothetical protein